MDIDSSGIYTGGLRSLPVTGWDWFIEKRNISTGDLDSGFDGDGLLRVDGGTGWDYCYDLVVDSNYIYAAGVCSPASVGDWQVGVWHKGSGAPVSGFGSGGIVRNLKPGQNDFAYGIAVDANYIYVVGVVNYNSTERWRIEKRYILTGEHVGGFGNSGSIEQQPGSSWNRLQKVAVDEHYVYVVGGDNGGVGGSYRWVVEKRRKDTGGF